MTAYYNEFDPKAAAWLRELIKAGAIPAGDVDERSITEVRASDLLGYRQCHFFAGIGGWPYALRLAGWPDDREVWTGSCPCQPFSAAGKRQGAADERHLWPVFRDLIGEGKPPVVFGEQVASSEVVGTELEAAFLVAVQSGNYARANKLAKRLAQSRGFHYAPRWVDAVRRDLETVGYSLGFMVLGAHSAGAPHIRQRLFWVAESKGTGGWANDQTIRGGEAQGLREPQGQDRGRPEQQDGRSGDLGPTGGLGDSARGGCGVSGDAALPGEGGHADGPDGPGGMALTDGWHSGAEGLQRGGEHGQQPEDGRVSPWADLAWLPCRDGKARPTQPGLFPLAHGVPSRVGLLRGYGNAIVPQAAAAFIGAYLDQG